MKVEKGWRIPVVVSFLVTLTMGLGAFGSNGAPLPADAAVEADLSAELGGKYEISRSEHFILAHRLEERMARKVLGWMEMTYDRVVLFCSENRLPMTRVDHRMVSVCITRSGTGTGRDGGDVAVVPPLSGFYDLTLKRSYFDAEWLPPGDGHHASILEEAARVTVQHEIAHQSLDMLCASLSERMPDWLAEGLACTFEVAADAGAAGFREPNSWRLKDAMGCLAPGARASSERATCVIERVLRDDDSRALGHWAPDSAFPERDSAVGVGAPSSRSPTWYAASWAIVHYLQVERAEALRRYLHSLVTHPASKSAAEHAALFERFFGPIDAALRARILATLKRV